MKYRDIVEGVFWERPNRFVAVVDIDGNICNAHVRNTGRCRELLIPGTRVYLEDHSNRMGSRKMRYSLIGVEKADKLINMDSQVPNRVVEEGLDRGMLVLPGMGKLSKLKREVTWGNSRFDVYVEDEEGKAAFVEVKGVTLESDGVAMFPDAPTERGLKHLFELKALTETGMLAYVIFLIQMEGVKYFTPNWETHREFAEALKGIHPVRVMAFESVVRTDEIYIGGEVEVVLPTI